MKAVVVGGTGLVGSALLDELSSQKVPTVAIARRTGEPRIGVLWNCTDLARLQASTIPKGTTAAFCALGTTIGNVGGSQAEFRHVDHDLVLAFAHACRKAGVKTFVAVSAAGADAGSRIFYNQVKGQMEDDLKAVGFASLTILRPGLLLGPRQEKRRLERVLRRVTLVLRPVLPGVLKGAKDVEVARTMVASAQEALPGVRVLANRDIRVLGRTPAPSRSASGRRRPRRMG
jgi:uncharacterized protein YbjT (DUF2867 family)